MQQFILRLLRLQQYGVFPITAKHPPEGLSAAWLVSHFSLVGFGKGEPEPWTSLPTLKTPKRQLLQDTQKHLVPDSCHSGLIAAQSSLHSGVPQRPPNPLPPSFYSTLSPGLHSIPRPPTSYVAAAEMDLRSLRRNPGSQVTPSFLTQHPITQILVRT